MKCAKCARITGVFAFTEADLADDTQGETPAPAGETPAPHDASAGETPEETFDPVRAKALIDKLRLEARDRNKLQKELDTLKARDLSETERLQQELKARDEELNTYRTRQREYDAREAVVKAAAGAIKPDAIWRMVRADIEYDDDGSATNVKQLLAATRAEFPELFRPANGSADGGQNGRAVPHDDMNAILRGQIARR